MPRLKLKIELVHTGDDAPTKTVKDLSRQLRITALTVILTLGMLIGLTMAWFAMNKAVDADTMSVNVQTNPNLVITASAAEIPTATSSSVTASFSGTRVLTPATHVTPGENEDWADQWPGYNPAPDYTGLKYNSNPSAISGATGYAKSGKTATFEPVPVAENGPYYRDFVVYIASVDQALDAESGNKWQLNASFDGELNTVVTGQNDYQYAASVDFYLGAPSEATYKGTLDLSYKDGDLTADPTDTVDLFAGEASDVTSIPYNKAASGNYITVTMRIYFDGALQKSAADAQHAAQAYVYSNQISTDDISLKVHFEAEEVSAS